MGNTAASPKDNLLIDIIHTINHYRLFVFAVLLTGAGLVAIALGLINPIYRAEAIVLIAPMEAVSNRDMVRSTGFGDTDAVVESQVRVLGSRQLAQTITAEMSPDEWPAAQELWITWPWAGGDETASDYQQLTDRFLKGLSVARDGKSNAIKVAFESTDPHRAARFANAVAEQYLADQLTQKSEISQRATAWLAGQVQAVQVELDAAESALSLFLEKSNERNENGIAVQSDDLVNIKRDLASASADRAAKQVALRRIRDAAPSADFVSAYEDLGGSPVLQRLFELKNRAVRREAELSSQFGARHPQIIDIKSEIRELSSRIYAERMAMVERLASEVEQATVREATLQRELNGLKSQTLTQRDVANEIESLEREVDLSRRQYEDYISRFQAAADREYVHVPDGRVLSAAVPPEYPHFPNAPLFAGATLLASLASALLLIFVREQTDRGFRSAREIETVLGLPCLTLVPKMSIGRSADLETHDYVKVRPQSRLAESLRGLLSTVKTQQERGSVIIISSAMPDEGKTTTAVSLARVAACEGLRTVLIDADLRRPRVQLMLGEPIAPGLIDYLQRGVGFEQVIRHARSAGEPDVILGARRPQAPVSVLAQDGMAQLLARLRGSHDLILIDTAPLAAVADARMLARFADSVLMLVRWNSTPKALVEHCIQRLREAGANSIACVMTQVDLKRYARQGTAQGSIASRQLAAYYSD